MKLPVDTADGPQQGMCLSASPNGLDPAFAAAWAKYFSKFISAYRARGVEIWGVTVQNEPEAAVGWEAMLYTPQYAGAICKGYRRVSTDDGGHLG
jgi:glucosylceramidase